uniref:Reticulon domain-containing protein n=1 Tax=Fagus sylvatica TaxID=28930 RepID=A0A2N9I729_FAGSY
MDSTPPSHRSEPRSRIKSASRLETEESSHLSIDLIPPPSLKKTPSPATLSLRNSNSLPLHELLLLSPSPLRKSKTRLTDRLEMAEELVEPNGSRRRCKSRAAQMGLLGCASPRNSRRTRRRSELEIREEKEPSLMEEMGKPRKRRHSGRPKKEKLSLVPSMPSSSSSPKTEDEDGSNLDRIGQMITDLIMWRDAAKSSLWFGFGTLCFFSSCFAKGINFRNNVATKRDLRLKEDDILRLGKLILPATNLAISKTRELFSGEPSMTLKVAPFLLLGAEYGHLITIWRLCAIAECIKWWVLEAWGACSHKKIVAASAVTAFWNLSSVKTRIFTAFISLVVLRYYRQHLVTKLEEEGEAEEKEQEQQQQQALVVVEGGLGGFWNPNLPFRKRPKKTGSKSSDSAETTSRPGYRFPLKQAATAGSLALTGDTIAQLRDRWTKRKPLDSDSNAFTKKMWGEKEV